MMATKGAMASECPKNGGSCLASPLHLLWVQTAGAKNGYVAKKGHDKQQSTAANHTMIAHTCESSSWFKVCAFQRGQERRATQIKYQIDVVWRLIIPPADPALVWTSWLHKYMHVLYSTQQRETNFLVR